jgi:BarA-like signal transduction histidine kinase
MEDVLSLVIGVFYVSFRQPVSLVMQELATAVEVPREVLLALQSFFIEALSHHASGPVQKSLSPHASLSTSITTSTI